MNHIQQETFQGEIDDLLHGKSVKKDSRLASLNPVLHNGLLRVKGRLDLPLEKCPIILPNSHHVTTLIIRSCHERNGHTGMLQVLSSLREKFWILKVPSTVRKVLGQCAVCKRYQGSLCSQQMAPIIEDQKSSDRPSFTYVGVDYFGPFNVKIERSTVKRYGCIFMCLTTRAVHLEVAHTLTTNSFIAAFQRFTSRRGTPEKVYSDNGTNLVSGELELRKSMEQWNQANISRYMSHRDITWTFNLPYTSHRGGVWERMIRETRQILKAIANEQLLSEEQLVTFMVEAECIINDRPIASVSNDPRDLLALTPSMLLLMKSNISIPPGVFDKKDNYARRWWRQVQYLADIFWRRWIREYLPTLQQRNKWQTKRQDIKIDDIVIITDDNISRGQWPLGRVIDVVKSRDGHVCSCVVKTSQSQVVRPITKLCLLECSV